MEGRRRPPPLAFSAHGGRYGSDHTTRKRTERLGKATGVRAGERARPDQQGVHRPLQRPGLRREESLLVPRWCLRGPGSAQGRARGADPGPAAGGTGQEGLEEGCPCGQGRGSGARTGSAGRRGACACAGSGSRAHASSGTSGGDPGTRGRADPGTRGRSAVQEGHLVQADERPPCAATGRAGPRAADPPPRHRCSGRSASDPTGRGAGTRCCSRCAPACCYPDRGDSRRASSCSAGTRRSSRWRPRWSAAVRIG
jgi:hypothetical protein